MINACRISRLRRPRLNISKFKSIGVDVQIKRYNVVIHGRVQDIGFRDLVAQMGNFLRLKDYVKIIVEGAADTRDSFLEDIRIKTGNIGAEIDVLDKREASFDIDLPPRFVKIPTTEF